MESYDTEGLITIQVAQLEKEKKELTERLRIVAKRIDHVERGYRKEERPLLAQDYEVQQLNDRQTFEEIQKARLEAAKLSHQEALATKARLSVMLDDYNARRDVIISKKGEEFAKRKEAAQRKMAEEKEKRRKAFLKAKEEERRQLEQEEALRREQEAAEQLAAAGLFRFLSNVNR